MIIIILWMHWSQELSVESFKVSGSLIFRRSATFFTFAFIIGNESAIEELVLIIKLFLKPIMPSEQSFNIYSLSTLSFKIIGLIVIHFIVLF